MVNHTRTAAVSRGDTQQVLAAGREQRREAAREHRRSLVRVTPSGPFSGKHPKRLTPILPPEWDMTPQEYVAAVESPEPVVVDMGLSGSAAVSGAGMAASPLGALAGAGDAVTPSAIGLGAAVGIGGLAVLARQVRRHRAWRRADRMLGHRNPAEVVDIGATMPPAVWTLLHEIVALDDIRLLDWGDREVAHPFRAPDNSAYVKERAERLAFGYRMAQAFHRPDGKTWTLEGLITAHPEDVRALVEYGCGMRTFRARAAAKEILDVLARVRADDSRRRAALRRLQSPTRPTQQARKPHERRPSERDAARKAAQMWRYAAENDSLAARKASKWTSMNFPSSYTHDEQRLLLDDLAAIRHAHEQTQFEVQWADAVATHDRVADAWTALITDPLAALDHSMLLDVTQPRTAAFITAYGEAQDLRSLHGIAYPTSARADDVVREYLRAVRTTEQAWTEAVRHAKHVHLNWLPADEAKRVRQASALLRTADDDETPLHLRAEAAQKAADLLRQVHTFTLPAATHEAIETKARLELAAPS